MPRKPLPGQRKLPFRDLAPAVPKKQKKKCSKIAKSVSCGKKKKRQPTRKQQRVREVVSDVHLALLALDSPAYQKGFDSERKQLRFFLAQIRKKKRISLAEINRYHSIARPFITGRDF